MRPLGQVHRRGRGDVHYQRVCGSTTAVSRKDHLAGRCKSVSASTPGRLHAMQAKPIAGCGWKWLYQQLQSLHVARHDPMSPPACSPSCSLTATYDHLANPSEHGPSQAAHLVPVHCRPAATPTDPMPPRASLAQRLPGASIRINGRGDAMLTPSRLILYGAETHRDHGGHDGTKGHCRTRRRPCWWPR